MVIDEDAGYDNENLILHFSYQVNIFLEHHALYDMICVSLK
ncbi:hypothetical protein DERF_004655 [Dermatophagoides farinae]|uniref:Uncharacterized protein n=1 Tax=Dermatophagoides farinae TaxID=6954 RepID=A0A922I590_DERFA|nr:hypothetical protein DERF_004655 [Dermatophagoides farinae]